MKKLSVFITIILITTMSLTACSPASPTEQEKPATPLEEEAVESDAKQEELVLTLDELAEFNGQDGNPAYLAVDGVIYDVTNSDFWKNGKHNGFTAGNDLTREIKEVSPHGISKLENVVEVGKLEE